MHEDYRYRQEHVEARPSRTYSTQAAVVARAPERERKNLVIAAPLSEVSKRRDAPVKFEKIDAPRRQTIGVQAKEVTKFRTAREQWESIPKSAATVEPIKAQPQIVQPQKSKEDRRPAAELPQDAKSSKQRKVQPQQSQKNIEPPMAQRPSNESVLSMPDKVKIPRSPVTGKPASAPGKLGNPPVRPDIPKPESNIRLKEPYKRTEDRAKSADKSKLEPNISSKSVDKANSKDQTPTPGDTTPADGKNQDKKGKSEGKNRDQ